MNTPVTWSGGAEPKQLQSYLTSANYFDVLGLTPAAGRFFLPAEDTHPNSDTVVVISYALWANKFGIDPNVIGKPMILNAVPFTIIGVAPRGFKGTVSLAAAEQVMASDQHVRPDVRWIFRRQFSRPPLPRR